MNILIYIHINTRKASPTCVPSLWSWWNRGWGWASGAGWSGGWGAASCSTYRARSTPENTAAINNVSSTWRVQRLLPGGQEVTSYRQPLWEVEAALRLGGGAGVAVDGAEEAGLVEAELLELLRVLCQRGRKQKLLQRHLRRRQTERGTDGFLFNFIWSLKLRLLHLPQVFHKMHLQFHLTHAVSHLFGRNVEIQMCAFDGELRVGSI